MRKTKVQSVAWNLEFLRENRLLLIIVAILIILFFLAIQGMETQDWVITVLRALSVGAITFLVASGFSIIFGLMDVLNLAHGTLFMIGAYLGWTVFVRPDTFVDLLTPIGLIAGGLALYPLWSHLVGKIRLGETISRIPRRFPPAARAALDHVWPWAGLAAGLLLLFISLREYPITIWDPGVYAESPITYAFQATQGQWVLPEPVLFTVSPYRVLSGLILGGLLASISFAGLTHKAAKGQVSETAAPLPGRAMILAGVFYLIGLGAFMFHGSLTDLLSNMDTTLRFFVAVLVAFLAGAILGVLIESALIRPLYTRPVYQILMTLGLSLIGVEIVRAIWGRPEFTMPKPALFNGEGGACPAANLGDLFANQCSTMFFLGGRIRTYNEFFIPLVGLVVLVGVWLLLQRTRLGMIIRAGVQDREMVEALGINVRRVFTMVFALGVGLAALGGVIASPSMGLSNGMGDRLLIYALIALAIGGLTSFPGAAVGALLVGLLQQFIIRYGQIGINLPFLDVSFKPTPPLVPASTVLLMVIVLLLLPNGLFGRKE
jgi:branched-chain amino acid transport system permease protein